MAQSRSTSVPVPPPALGLPLKAKPSDIVGGLNHPIRRASLRFLLDKGPANVTQIATSIPHVSDGNVRSHLDVLVSSGLASKEKRLGFRESFYSPCDVPRSSWVRTVLRLTAEED